MNCSRFFSGGYDTRFADHISGMKGCSTGSISSEAKTILERAASTHGKSTGYEITSEPDTYRLGELRDQLLHEYLLIQF